ncbi:MAG: hypothetical protein JXB34_08105 [Bacteroidales bacterium]|nr:hypothetical protein [Bacteroidales bacterium]
MIQKILKHYKTENKLTTSQKQQIERNSGRQVQFYNFWEQPFDEMYWYRFLKSRPGLLNKNPKLKIGFFSVFGDRNLINHTKCDINIFYGAENLKTKSYLQYADYFLLSDKINLSMGFECFEHEKYIRFPNWMDVFFMKTSDIKTTCNHLRFPPVNQKTKFASCISSHSANGLRDALIDSLNSIETVSCAGKYRHNDDSLLTLFNDKKTEYLKSFYFNICPENSNAFGYVTEKIFQSVYAGCIPVYWGSNNRPEPDVLNHNAIVFWEKGKDNQSAINFISDLYNSPRLMNDFISQPRLAPKAEEYIMDTFARVENKMLGIISANS